MSDPKMSPRYMEIATFMRTAMIGALYDYDIAMVGIPYDGGITNRPGARFGPREIRNSSSLMRSIHHVTGINPYDLCSIGDAGDVRLSQPGKEEVVVKEIEEYYARLKAAGVIPLTAGGDHSISFPILKALGADEPVALIHIDAHTDTWGPHKGSKFHHGAPFRLAVEAGVLDPKKTIQIGIRGAQNVTEGWDYSHESGMRVVFMEEFSEIGVDKVIAEACRVVGDSPTYISFDIDGLDPVYAPGTGTPEIGGITTLEALKLLRGLGGLNLIGGDVVEVAPAYDQTGNTALVGATLMYEILCLLATEVDKRR